MEVQLLRTPPGTIVFMKANSDFVDLLVRLLEAPVGALTQLFAEDDAAPPIEVPFLNIAQSVLRLKDAVFVASRPYPMPKAAVWEEVFQKEQPKTESATSPSQNCLLCLKRGVRQRLQEGRFCPACTMTSGPCDLSVPTTCRSCRKVLIPPSTGRCPVCQLMMSIIVTFQDVHEHTVCARCMETSGVARLMAGGGGRRCPRCQRSELRVCSHCEWCDACSIHELGFTVEGWAATPPEPPPAAPAAARIMKDAVEFMVTDSLEIFEVSPIKMIELMAGQCDDLKQLRTATVEVTAEHMKKLVLHALSGSRQVLTATFPAADAEA